MGNRRKSRYERLVQMRNNSRRCAPRADRELRKMENRATAAQMQERLSLVKGGKA